MECNVSRNEDKLLTKDKQKNTQNRGALNSTKSDFSSSENDSLVLYFIQCSMLLFCEFREVGVVVNSLVTTDLTVSGSAQGKQTTKFSLPFVCPLVGKFH